MKNSKISFLAAAVGTLLAAEGCSSSAKPAASIVTAGAAVDRSVTAAEMVDHWSNLSALAARRLIAEYDVPDEISSDRLVWNDKGPWRRIIVRNAPPSAAEGKDLDIVEQAVDYSSLTPAQAVNLAAFDDRLAFDPGSRRLSARSDREEYNILRLNLADDVVHERLSPEKAKDSYFKILALEESGKTSPDLLSLHLTP